MRVARTVAALRDEIAASRRERVTIGLVPTMGALHQGHLALLGAARRRCDVVVMSLFVNPAQFAPDEDLDRYPRDEARDLALAADADVDFVYAPSVAEVYPQGFSTFVEVGGNLADVLEGDPRRRGREHFRGVATVVAKLFNTVEPDVAFFGQKDAQQAAVIERMARDLDFAVEIAVIPTVREPDGLALSSRNAYLAEEDRSRAAALHRALTAVEREVANGTVAADAALTAGVAVLEAAGIEAEYLEARHLDDLTEASSFNGRPVLVAIAARVGGARLIDNIVIEAGSSGETASQDRERKARP